MTLDHFLRELAALRDLPLSVRQMAERSGRRVSEQDREKVLTEVKQFLTSYTALEKQRAENFQHAADTATRVLHISAAELDRTAVPSSIV